MKKIMSRFLLFAVMLVPTVLAAQERETRKVDNFTSISFRVPGKLLLRQGSPQKVEIEGKKDVLAEIETEVEGSRLIIGKEGSWFNWDWNDNDRVTIYITVLTIEGLSVSGSGDLIGETKLTARDMDLNVSGSGSMQVEVEASGDIEADVSGSGNMDLKGKCRNFESDVSGSGGVSLTADISESADFGVSGSGRIRANGAVDKVKIAISGSGKVLASDLTANRCNIRISGSGDAEVNVKNELDADITGSGSVSYKGNPDKVNSHASGSGRVRKY